MGSQSSDTSETDTSTVSLTSPTREHSATKSKSLSDVISSLSEKSGSASEKPATKRTKSIADITKNLAKSLEKSSTIDMQSTASLPKDQPKVTDTPSKPKISASKLSDVISTLKEKSKAATAQLPTSKFKDVSLSSRPANDSKLLDILKRGTAGVSPKELKSKSCEQKNSKNVSGDKKDVIPQRKSVISPVLTVPEETGSGKDKPPIKKSPIPVSSSKSPPALKSPTTRIKSPVIMSVISHVDDDQKSKKSHSESIVSPKSAESPTTALSPKHQPKSPKSRTTLKSPVSRSSPRLSPNIAKNEGKKSPSPNPVKTLNSSLSPNVDRSGCSPSSLDSYSSPADSPVYSPAIKSNPVAVPTIKPGHTRDDSSAISVITPTRTPTPVQSPLSNTLTALRSPKMARLDSSSPSFPASPPQLIKDTNHTSQLTKPTAILAKSKQENKDELKVQSNDLQPTIVSHNDTASLKMDSKSESEKTASELKNNSSPGS